MEDASCISLSHCNRSSKGVGAHELSAFMTKAVMVLILPPIGRCAHRLLSIMGEPSQE